MGPACPVITPGPSQRPAVFCTGTALSGEIWWLLAARVQPPALLRTTGWDRWLRTLAAFCADAEKQGKAVESHAGNSFQTWFLSLAMVGPAGPDRVLGEARGGAGLT